MAIISKWSLNWNANDSNWTNNWTATNITYVQWKQNQWWRFNGSSSVIQCSDSASLSITWNYSFNIWFYANALPSSWQVVTPLSKYDETWNNWWYEFYIWNNAWVYNIDNRFRTSWWGTQSNNNIVSISTWKWFMFTWVLNWTSLSSYLNWVLLSTSTVSWVPWNNTKLLNIWNFWYYTPSAWNLSRWFNWIIDEVEIHNSALSSTEIKNKYLYYNWFM